MPEEAKAFGNTPYLELEPADRDPVSFIMQPPSNASPGDHNVVLFFEMFDLPDVRRSQSQVSGSRRQPSSDARDRRVRRAARHTALRGS